MTEPTSSDGRANRVERLFRILLSAASKLFLVDRSESMVAAGPTAASTPAGRCFILMRTGSIRERISIGRCSPGFRKLYASSRFLRLPTAFTHGILRKESPTFTGFSKGGLRPRKHASHGLLGTVGLTTVRCRGRPIACLENMTLRASQRNVVTVRSRIR